MMAITLTIVPEKGVKALIDGVAFGGGIAQAPLAKSPCGITGLFEQFRKGIGAVRYGVLTLRPDLIITPYRSMACVLTGHQYGTGRGAYRASGVMLSEQHPLLRELVNIRCSYFFLSIAPQITISQIVGNNVDNVRECGGRFFSGLCVAPY